MATKRSFSIMGDSYSTFVGYIPENYSAYYPNPEKVPDLLQVEQTWWHQLMTKRNMELLENDSYSGSTVCTVVRPEQKLSASFVRRSECCLRGKQPDFLMVFGCTNDNWLDREVGQVQFADWTEEDLQKVLPAYCYVLHQLKAANPTSKFLCIINTNFKQPLLEGLLCAAQHYGATAVQLQDIDKSNGHPTALGMSQIAQQIEKAMF